MISLGVAFLGLTTVTPAEAGGVDLSVGIGLPVPVVVAAPPMIVQSGPVVVSPPAVVVQEPPIMNGRPLPPGLANKYSGSPPPYGWKSQTRARHGWDHDDEVPWGVRAADDASQVRRLPSVLQGNGAPSWAGVSRNGLYGCEQMMWQTVRAFQPSAVLVNHTSGPRTGPSTPTYALHR